MMDTFILCGGSGERFEGDKTREVFGNSTVLEAVVDSVMEPVLVVDDPERYSWLDPAIPFLIDRHPGAGPAAAIVQIIEHARRRHLEVVGVISCDMPTIDPRWWDRLLAAEGPAAAFHDGERWQPLFAIFRPDEIEIDGEWKHEAAWRLLEAIGATRVEPPANFDRLVSINTRDDLERARAIAGKTRHEEE